METSGKLKQGEAAMKHVRPARTTKPTPARAHRRVRAARPAGEQAIGSRLYAQIRQAIAELKR